MLDQVTRPVLALPPRALAQAFLPAPRPTPADGALPAGSMLRGGGLSALHASSRRDGAPLQLRLAAEQAWLAVLDFTGGAVSLHELAGGWQEELVGVFERLYLILPFKALGEARLRDVPRPGAADAVALALGAALVAAAPGAPAESLFLALRAHLLKAHPAAAPTAKGSGLAPWQVRKAQAMMEARAEAGVCVEELARECRLSRSYFSRAFKQSTGVPPHVWLAAHRIEKAKRMLAEDGLRIAEVAAECGFSDQSHLTRSFAAHVGLTPAAFRRRAWAGGEHSMA